MTSTRAHARAAAIASHIHSSCSSPPPCPSLSQQPASKNTPKLTLATASYDQYVTCTTANHEAWGQRITVAQHLERELMLLKSNFARTHNPFVLLDEAGNIAASFETYAVPCLYCTDGKEIKRGEGTQVASVFVSEKNRGKGYASTMLSTFNKQAKAKGYIFSDLYADVDPKVYNRIGWKEYPAPNVAVDVASFSKSTHFSTHGTTTFEDGETAHKLIKEDERITYENMKEKIRTIDSSTAVTSYILTHAKLEWASLFSQFYAKVLNYVVPTRWGAFIDNNNYIFWTHEFRDMELNVLKLRSTSPQNTQKLISAAVAEAQTFSFPKVNIWWNLPQAHAKHLGLEITYRVNSSIPMISWFLEDKRVEWINVERYEWV